MTDTSAPPMTRDLVVKRLLDAPVELVWEAWTKPEHIKQWWGPSDYTSPAAEIDLREGGRFLYTMRAPDWQGGGDSYVVGTFSKIVPLQRLEFTQSLADAAGNKVDPQSLGMPADFPPETRTVVEFKDVRGFTELTVTEYAWPVGQFMIFSLLGLHQMLDKFTDSLPQR